MCESYERITQTRDAPISFHAIKQLWKVKGEEYYLGTIGDNSPIIYWICIFGYYSKVV